MKKLSLIASVLAVLGLTACEKELDEIVENGGDGQVKNSMLQVRTRGGSLGDETTIAYPVQVFVFQGDDCKAVQTIGDEGQTLNIPLVEGTYSVYAVGGAGSTDYNLPTKDNATTTTALTLKEGRSLTDLMAASATATLVDGGTNTVTLGMTRKTMLIQDVTIKKIPTAATAVSVTIAPLWQALTVSGAFANAGQSQTIALTKQADNRTWTLPSPFGEGSGVRLLPPSSQPASVSVNITIGGTTKTYTYSTSDQLEAAYKINIDGTYVEAAGVSLTGTITGATWLGERTISFNFDENGSSTVVDGSAVDNSAAFPSAGDTYQGCYVLAVDDADDHADVTLLAPTELEFYDANASTMQTNIDAALATVTTGDISGWEVPTTDEAHLMYDAREAIGNLSAGSYLCLGGTGYRAFKPTDAAFSTSSSNVKASTVLRPVVTITINKE
ncbi:MAG: FimB/Mfa2 family fimbrial subunit [Paludibacteraceae bacterium]|nr:FimB/Mfa2 family fimbrial subunit [Paludibacteraceae bacterium]